MKTQNNDSGDLKEVNGKGPVPLKLFEEMVKKDLQSCLHLLDAIYRDQDVLRGVATFLHGKYMNGIHQKELEAQQKLDI